MTIDSRATTCAGFLAAAITATVMPYGVAAQTSEATPCPREPAIFYTKGSVRDVTNEPPCRLFFRPTGVRLTGAADGSRPDPGPLVVRDGRGRYYSANADGWESTISVWSADGAYLSSFGRAGEGPGEFKGEGLTLFVDDGDTLHVLDSRDWMVFSPEHEFVRQVTGRQIGYQTIVEQTETLAPYYDGRILASAAHPSTGDAYFRIVNRDGSLDDTFGTSEEGTGASGHYGHDRAIAYPRGNRGFWAAPSIVPPISLDSSLATLPGSKREEALDVSEYGRAGFGEKPRKAGGPAEAVEPYEEIMREGGRRWTPELDREVDELSETLVHMVAEVIDVNSAQLLASESHLLGDVMRGDALLPPRLFRNSLTGYVYRIGEDGVPYVEIVEGVLEKK